MSENKKKQVRQIEDEQQAELGELAVDAKPELTTVPQGAPVKENKDEALADSEKTESDDASSVTLAKAGKRSKKALEQEQAEEKRKAKAEDKESAPVKKAIKHIPNMKKRHGKRYLTVRDLVEREKEYELEEAITLAKKTATVKFDSSLELHLNLGVDPRQADQMVRSSVVLPAGSGKTLRVAVLVGADKADEAKKAGADKVGEAELMSEIEKGKIDFDILISTPDMMPKLAKLAKVLGPKGLMPNPKSGTVTSDPAKAVKEAKAGKLEFRIDKQAIVHLAIGKASFKEEDLLQNAKALIQAVMQAKPSAAKGTYVKAMHLTTSMGPGIKLDVTKAIAAANPRS